MENARKRERGRKFEPLILCVVHESRFSRAKLGNGRGREGEKLSLLYRT